MADGVALTLSCMLLAASLGAAVTRRPVSEAAVAAAGAALLVALGAVAPATAWRTVRELGPTLGFLAALLVIGECCRRAGLFAAIAARLAGGARRGGTALLGSVFGAAVAVTAVLSLDATVVLLTPVVLAAAARARAHPAPHLLACGHLANSASLALPVSNLTNLLALQATGLSFTRFATVTALPTVAAVGVEWLVLRRRYARELRSVPDAAAAPAAPVAAPRGPLVVLTLTLAGFVLSAPLGIAPAWAAVAGGVALALPLLRRGELRARDVAAAAQPAFLLFVAGIGVIVAAASAHGLGTAVAALVPAGTGPADLLAVAVLAAVLANLLNNLPATLVLVPLVAPAGPAPVLAALVGLNVGPNLTPAGSLATLLWRRVLDRGGHELAPGEFVRLGLLTVPAGIAAATGALWLACRVALPG